MSEMINVCLEKMSVVHMIVQRRSSEGVYDVRLEGFLYGCVCSCLHM